MERFMMAQLDTLEGIACPCGTSRRAFMVEGNETATVHLVEIAADSRAHYHKTLTEIYIVLEGEGHLELDGRRLPVRPLTAVLIKPGCRHRAVGRLRLLNIVVPSFDPDDEWEDT